MSDTLPDVPLIEGQYVDIYAATGIAVGTRVVIQNKTNGFIRVQESAAQPANDSTDGVFVETKKYVIAIGTNGCWVKGSGDISVQPV